MPHVSDKYGVLEVTNANENDSETSSSYSTIRIVSFGAWQIGWSDRWFCKLN